eukprot:COSAG01_NODE_90_length_27307_cov_734.166458_19_plen_151_part_00
MKWSRRGPCILAVWILLAGVLTQYSRCECPKLETANEMYITANKQVAVVASSAGACRRDAYRSGEFKGFDLPASVYPVGKQPALVADAGACCAICAKTEGCRGWTMVGCWTAERCSTDAYKRHQCWLKQAGKFCAAMCRVHSTSGFTACP